MFFLIWGSKGVKKLVQEGNVECPVCRGETRYKLIDIQKYFTLFFIPIFPLGRSFRYLECQQCETTFNPDYSPLGDTENPEQD